jgi:tRNA(fMet)-specific endonuclease VapC
LSYLLDTNICIYALNGSDAGVLERLRRAKRSELCVSSVTIAELYFGAARSGRAKKNAQRVGTFVAPLAEVAFDRKAAEAYGAARAKLAARGRQIGTMDMLIAATALGHGLVMVTNNEREFQRVSGLRVENWASGAAGGG